MIYVNDFIISGTHKWVIKMEEKLSSLFPLGSVEQSCKHDKFPYISLDIKLEKDKQIGAIESTSLDQSEYITHKLTDGLVGGPSFGRSSAQELLLPDQVDWYREALGKAMDCENAS